MTFAREKSIAVSSTLAAALAIVGAGLAWTTGRGAIRREYPDSPFPKVNVGYPQLIALREPPGGSNEAVWEEYNAKRSEAWRYLEETGAISRATAEEREAVALVRHENYVKGQLLATQILSRDSRSVPALYALARAVEEGDADLPCALFVVRKARHVLEERGRANPTDSDAREWYIRVLDGEYRILSGLDRTHEALRVVEVLEQVYHGLTHWKVWPFFKQKRLAEAEAAIDAAERSGNWPETSRYDRMLLNVMLHRRQETYAAGKAFPHDLNSSAHWYCIGLAAVGDFRLNEARQAYLTATKSWPNYHGTGYVPLASLYLQSGAFADTLDALKLARQQRSLRDPGSLQFDQAMFDWELALLLLSTGQVDESERFARRCYEIPDRPGGYSDTRDDGLLVNDLLLWTVLQARREALREVGTTTVASTRTHFQNAALELETWKLARQALSLIRESDRPNVLRPYLPGGLACPAWILAGAVRMLPAGVVGDLLAKARAEEDHPRAVPYFDAFEAEAALRASQPETALRLANRARQTLPNPGENVLRALSASVAAEAAARLGREAESFELWSRVLIEFPAALRLRCVGIPVTIHDDGSVLARRLAETLSASPRLQAARRGFIVQIKVSSGALAFSLIRPDGRLNFERSVPVAADPAQVVASAARTFHQCLMTPGFRLSAQEINAPDGVPLDHTGPALNASLANK